MIKTSHLGWIIFYFYYIFKSIDKLQYLKNYTEQTYLLLDIFDIYFGVDFYEFSLTCRQHYN